MLEEAVPSRGTILGKERWSLVRQKRGTIYIAWCVCRGEVKDKAELTGWLHSIDLLGNLNEAKSPLFE